ncbi:MAG: hypothetical protein C4K47_03025 [Candidatus Thorarchaeota archaeon]|nr:MAG: hypothetical protein C4K47_03025 [Candidatus Thorarchaeota archaeon]
MGETKVTIATRNPKVLYQTVKLLESLEVGFSVCNPGDSECDTANVVITTEDEAWSAIDSRIVKVGPDPDPDLTAIEVKMRLLGIKRPSITAIGVDPGMRIGLAITMDGRPVHTKTVSSPVEAAKLTLDWLYHVTKKYSEGETLVRVGTGSPLYSVLYLRGILGKITATRIELVNEHHTTVGGGADSDQSSATIIASRHGRVPSGSDILIEPKEEYVRSLKQLFARLTDGRRSLTTGRARSVLTGGTSLEKLLDDSN